MPTRRARRENWMCPPWHWDSFFQWPEKSPPDQVAIDLSPGLSILSS